MVGTQNYLQSAEPKFNGKCLASLSIGELYIVTISLSYNGSVPASGPAGPREKQLSQP